ncbi:MAG TPA: hypothetical protein VF103_09565 [Polyangiaceae bacterium]
MRLGFAALALALSCSASRPNPPARVLSPARVSSSDPPTPAAPRPAETATSEAPKTAPPSPCRGASLRLEDIWNVDCQLADPLPVPDVPPDIAFDVVAQPAYVSGEPGSIGVVFENRSTSEAELIFGHFCTGMRPDQMFDLRVTDASGASAMLEQKKPGFGLLASLDCEFPYVHAFLPPKGRITSEVPFFISAVKQLSEPKLREGPLTPGVYTVEVIAPHGVVEPPGPPLLPHLRSMPKMTFAKTTFQLHVEKRGAQRAPNSATTPR